MTDSMDRSTARLILRDSLVEALRSVGRLPRTGVITHCVTVVQTYTEDADGTRRYDIHRIHPLGALDPSTERGILQDAIDDSRDHRRHAG